MVSSDTLNDSQRSACNFAANCVSPGFIASIMLSTLNDSESMTPSSRLGFVYEEIHLHERRWQTTGLREQPPYLLICKGKILANCHAPMRSALDAHNLLSRISIWAWCLFFTYSSFG